MFGFIIFFGVPLVFLYIGQRLIGPSRLSRGKKVLAWLVVAALVCLIYSSRHLRHHYPDGPFLQTYLTASYVIMGFTILLFSTLVIRDVFLIATRLWKRLASRPDTARKENLPPVGLNDPERRRFLVNSSNWGMVALTGALGGYGIFTAIRPPRISRVDVPLENLPSSLENLKIAQISDLHVGPILKKDYVETVVRRVMEMKPDLIVLTGDMVDGSVGSLRNDTAPLAELKAPLGVYFITGNHEYYSNVNDWIPEMERLGFDVLMNSHRLVSRGDSRLLIAGVPDMQARIFDPHRSPDMTAALHGAAETSVKIMLAHRPRDIFETARLGFDLQLSGHTHGGQIFPGQFLVKLAEPFISGLHRLDRTWIYVSRGTGFWGPPMRVGAPGEITDIRLMKSA